MPVLLLCTLVCSVLSIPCFAAQQQEQRGALGSKVEEFLLEGPFGATHRFPDRTSGKIDFTVVVFWATWSQPSERELDRLAALWPKWSKNRVEVIAINIESSRINASDLKTIHDRLEQNPLPFPVMLDRGLEAFHAYGVIAVPTTFVVDSNGTIVFRLPGYPVAGAEELEQTVEKGVIHTDLASRGDLDEASPGYLRAVRYTRLANLLAAQGETEMAVFTLKKAINEDPTFVEARISLAALHEQLDQVELAEDLLFKAAAEFPNVCAIHLAHAGLKLRQGDHVAALILAEAALQLDPELSNAMTLVARVHREGGHPEKAIPFLQKALELNPLDFKACLEFGKAETTLGNKAEAISWYERAYQILDPQWNP
ncbi:MAG: redoxin domain-containing protein [Planctomycetes bacterium]|nr:redoxin domain-containing protein [Planctomycetota bacterium]